MFRSFFFAGFECSTGYNARGEWIDQISATHHYWLNQWELGREGVALADDDPRRVPLSVLVQRVYDRYGADLLITETAHVDDMRPLWLHAVAEQAELLLRMGVPLRGVCLYPIIS